MSSAIAKPALEGSSPSGYEPPSIEMVLTADELDREVHYAGAQSGPQEEF